MTHHYAHLESTLGNAAWLRHHEAVLKTFFPEMWTHLANFDYDELSSRLQTVGVHCKDEAELHKTVEYLCRLGFVQRIGPLMRSNPDRIAPM